MNGMVLNMLNHKILILTPDLSAQGGISIFYKTLIKYLKYDYDYVIRGKRNFPFENRLISYFRIPYDYFKFAFILVKHRPNLVIINTSLHSNSSVLRDSVFLIVSKMLKITTITFFHGWGVSFADKNKNHNLLNLFMKSDGMILLTKQAKEFWLNKGFEKKIFEITTLIDDSLATNITKHMIIDRQEHDEIIKVLYLARVEIEKGIYEAIQAFSTIREKHKNIKFIIAGNGLELEKAKKFVSDNKLKDIEFLGFVSGNAKINAFNYSHIYLFPSYSEGMPISILEAMLFGLPIISTPVGGIVGFFEHKKNGYYIEIKNTNSIINALDSLIQNREERKRIGLYNNTYAIEKFLASIVAPKFEIIVDQFI